MILSLPIPLEPVAESQGRRPTQLTKEEQCKKTGRSPGAPSWLRQAAP